MPSSGHPDDSASAGGPGKREGRGRGEGGRREEGETLHCKIRADWLKASCETNELSSIYKRRSAFGSSRQWFPEGVTGTGSGGGQAPRQNQHNHHQNSH